MSCDGDQNKVSFCPVPSSEVQEEIIMANVSSTNTRTDNTTELTTKESGKRLTFGPQSQFDSPKFDFKKELDQLPFPVNIGEVELTKVQQ